LEKRDGFRRGFANFDIATVAQFGEADVDRLLNDTGIVRHRGKITATINNANRALEAIAAHGSLATFLWSFADPNDLGSGTVQRGTSPAATAMSKAMKKLGWKFVGPTTAYAFMQATGMVNDHAEGCHHRAISAAAIAGFTRP
jgi:DNA-3-methyladenine glycosylase I